MPRRCAPRNGQIERRTRDIEYVIAAVTSFLRDGGEIRMRAIEDVIATLPTVARNDRRGKRFAVDNR